MDHSGIDLIGSAPHSILDEKSDHPTLAKVLLRSGLGGNLRWIKSLQSIHPVLLHAHFLKDGLDAIVIGGKLRLPVVTTLHGHDITKHESKFDLRKGSRYFFRHVDKVIAVSDYIAQQALRKGCPEKKLVKHSIGIDLERFSEHKSESETPSLLFVGRLVEKKGCTYLLQAMGRLKKRYPELELVVVGEGNLKPQLQREAAEHNLRVKFVGTEGPEQIRDRLSRCWLFVVPSITARDGNTEGLGMVFLEAQAVHTPVVSFRTGGVVEAVKDGTTGLLCDEKDVTKLAENIDTLISNHSLRRQMGKNGRRMIENEFDVRKQCKLLESIYDDVC